MPGPNRTPPMQTGQTYQRPPNTSHTINHGSSAGTVGGKITGKNGPQVVNNSSQGRTLPKKQGR